MIRLYILAGLVAAIAGGAWYIDRSAYDRGVEATTAAQEKSNAKEFRRVIEEYSAATGDNISGDIADCILRGIESGGNAADCGDLSGVTE